MKLFHADYPEIGYVVLVADDLEDAIRRLVSNDPAWNVLSLRLYLKELPITHIIDTLKD